MPLGWSVCLFPVGRRASVGGGGWHRKADIFKSRQPLISPALAGHGQELVHSVIL